MEGFKGMLDVHEANWENRKSSKDDGMTQWMLLQGESSTLGGCRTVYIP